MSGLLLKRTKHGSCLIQDYYSYIIIIQFFIQVYSLKISENRTMHFALLIPLSVYVVRASQLRKM